MEAPTELHSPAPAHLRRPGISHREFTPCTYCPDVVGQEICIVCIEFSQREPEEQSAGDGVEPKPVWRPADASTSTTRRRPGGGPPPTRQRPRSRPDNRPRSPVRHRHRAPGAVTGASGRAAQSAGDREPSGPGRPGRVTPEAGLLAYRELDDALGLSETAGETLADARTGKNGRHALVGLLRQSMFGHLAGY